jgi:GNAT superfamily N-acetyltransferase
MLRETGDNGFAMPWKIRPALASDAPALIQLIDSFASSHPAAKVPRPVDWFIERYLGPKALMHVLVADTGERLVAFGAWRWAPDVFWVMDAGEVIDLYVAPEYRGIGVAPTLLASICAEVRSAGGEYICGTYGEEQVGTYERVAIGHPGRWCHVSARAFHRLADLAGKDPRTIVRMLPDPSWNKAR